MNAPAPASKARNVRDLIAKVRKLRSLAESANANEAAAAARAAEKIIQAHKLSEAAVSLPAAPEDVIRGEALTIAGWRVAMWLNNLLTTLQEAYQCDGFFEHAYQDGAKVARFVAYGRPEDVELLKYQHAWFSAEIERLTARNARGMGAQYANSYRLGLVHGIRTSLFEARQEERAKASARALEVVDARAAAASEAMACEAGVVSELQEKPDLDVFAFQAGERDGRALKTRTRLEEKPRALLGPGPSTKKARSNAKG